MNTLNTWDDYCEQRIYGVRDMMELNFDETDDNAVPIGTIFEVGRLKIAVLPVIGDSMMAVEVVGIKDDMVMFQHTLSLTDGD